MSGISVGVELSAFINYYTIEFWAYSKQYTTKILTLRFPPASLNFFVNNEHMDIVVNTPATQTTPVSNRYKPLTWNHIVLAHYDDTDQLVYLNGRKEINFPIPLGVLSPSNHYIESEHTDTFLREVRIWNFRKSEN